MRAEALGKTNQFHLGVSDYWLKRYEAGEGFARGDAWSLGLIRLADNQWIVHSGGEPCIEWRAKMSKWLAPLKIATWGYSQEAKSYLPTASMLPEGGYEVPESNNARASTPAPYPMAMRAAFRQFDPGIFLGVEQFPERAFLGMIGRGGIARGWPDAAILFTDEIVLR